METVTSANALTRILDQLFNSFLKSLEGLFSSAAKTEEKFEEGKYTITTTDKPKEPILDENGKPFPDNRNIFDIVIALQWPKEEKLTRNQVKELIKDKNTWTKAKRSISVILMLGSKNKVERNNIDVSKLNDEIKSYRQKFDIDHTATLIRETIQFLYEETDIDENAGEADNANASTKLCMTLKKITCDTNVEIRLMKINANYSISDALDDVDNIVSNDDFIDQLPDNQEISYEVTSDENDYDVNECEDFTCQDAIQQMIYDTFQLSFQLKLLDMSGPYDMYGGPANSFGNVICNLDCVTSILTNALIDMGCTSIPGFELCAEQIDLCAESTPSAFAVGMIEGYLNSLGAIAESLGEGSRFKLGAPLSQIEDTLRWLKQECK